MLVEPLTVSLNLEVDMLLHFKYNVNLFGCHLQKGQSDETAE